MGRTGVRAGATPPEAVRLPAHSTAGGRTDTSGLRGGESADSASERRVMGSIAAVGGVKTVHRLPAGRRV